MQVFDLATPRDKTAIASTVGSPIEAVYVIQLPAPVQLHFGAGGNPIDLEQGKSYEPCPSEIGGLLLSNAVAGGFLKLLISTEES